MTMTPRCDVAPSSGAMTRTDAQAVTDRMASFLADELFPLMAGLWPASANQLDGNARGAAMAFGQLLRGYTPAQIRDAVLALAIDTDRQFAPRPAELRQILAGEDQHGQPEACNPEISIAALRMQAQVLVFRGELDESGIDGMVQLMADAARRNGVTVTGGLQ